MQPDLLDRGRARCRRGRARGGRSRAPSRRSVEERAQRVVGGQHPGDRAGEPVGGQRVGGRLEQPGAVALAALAGVDGELRSSASATGSQSGSAAGPVIANPTTRLRSSATSTRLRASPGWSATPARPRPAAASGPAGIASAGSRSPYSSARRAAAPRAIAGGVVGPRDAHGDVGGGAGIMGAILPVRIRCRG